MKHQPNKTLNEIQSVHFASPINLFSYSAKSLKGSILQVNKDLKKYLTTGLLKSIPFNGEPISTGRKKLNSWIQFYTTTLAGARAIDRAEEYRQNESKSSNSQEHESMKIDVALSFIQNYPEYEFDFNYKADYKKIRPDILVNARHIFSDRRYTFFVEIERSKKEMTYIYNEKIVKYEKAIKAGLFDKKEFYKPKVLFVCSYNQYPFDLRPQQYQDKAYKPYLTTLYRLFGNLLNKLKVVRLSDKYYRFLPFPEFHLLHEKRWYLPSGEKVNIID